MLFVAVMAVTTAGRRARADVHCPVQEGTERHVADLDGRARLEWIDRRLSHEAPRMSLWNWGWGVGIGAAGLGTLIAVPFVSPESRVDYYTGAGAAAIGVLPFLLSPPTVIGASRELHGKLVAAAPLADTDVCPLLADAEVKLVQSARNAHMTTAWYAHLGNLAFNTAIVLFEGLLFDRWTGGLINGVSGFAIGETVIFTQPTQVIRDLGAYNRGDLSP